MDYEQYKIKTFDLWELYLHKNQFPYLGRCYAWASREKAKNLGDMTVDERAELFSEIIPSWEKAIQELYGPFLINLAFFGNTSQHLHAHFIPRNLAPRVYEGIIFEDPNPKGNYAPYPKKELSLEIVFKIRDSLKTKL